jgi:hypothetical protein
MPVRRRAGYVSAKAKGKDKRSAAKGKSKPTGVALIPLPQKPPKLPVVQVAV